MIAVGLTDDIATCHALRRAVFIEEQQVSEAEEIDGLDSEASHLLVTLDGQPMGTARLMAEGSIGKIGRVCVLAQARGKGLGLALMQAAIAEFRTRPAIAKVKLGAQTHALGFYAAMGFEAYGPEYLDAGIPHRDMILVL